MTTVFLIHGTMGNPQENWFPSMTMMLEAFGAQVIAPLFPTPEEQSLENWLQVMEPYRAQINENTIFVGHSLGVPFILSLLEQQETPIKACFFIAGFLHALGNETFDTLNNSFINKPFNWEHIRAMSGPCTIINAADDPYVPLSEGEELAAQTGGTLDVVLQGGHLNAAAGFTEFPYLLQKIRTLL